MDSSKNTKKKIYESLLGLIQNNPYDSITVADITNKAGITRQAFYYHFKNMFDIFLWQIKEKNSEMKQQKTLVEAVHINAKQLESEKAISFAIYNSKDRDLLRKTIFEQIILEQEKYSQKYINGRIKNSEIEIGVRFVSHAFVGIIVDWIGSNFKSNIESELKSLIQILEYCVKKEIFKTEI